MGISIHPWLNLLRPHTLEHGPFIEDLPIKIKMDMFFNSSVGLPGGTSNKNKCLNVSQVEKTIRMFASKQRLAG